MLFVPARDDGAFRQARDVDNHGAETGEHDQYGQSRIARRGVQHGDLSFTDSGWRSKDSPGKRPSAEASYDLQRAWQSAVQQK
jgi:hypothetical protein